jgi:hypothetical protein
VHGGTSYGMTSGTKVKLHNQNDLSMEGTHPIAPPRPPMPPFLSSFLSA